MTIWICTWVFDQRTILGKKPHYLQLNKAYALKILLKIPTLKSVLFKFLELLGNKGKLFCMQVKFTLTQ